MDRKSLTAVLELFAMVAAILLYGVYVHRQDPLLLGLNPHPFWAVVLLIAIRYGSPLGPVAGLVCAAVHVAGLGMVGLRLPEGFHLGMGSFVVPLLYVVAGLVVGEAVEWRLRRSEFLQDRLNELRERLDNSETRRGELERAYRSLEGRVAGQADTVITLYDNAKRLGSLQPGELYQGLTELLKRRLGVEQCSVWAVQEGVGLRKILPPGGPEDTPPQLAEAVLREGDVATAKELFLQQTQRPGAGLMAGALRDERSDIQAVVVVESMSFLGFTPTTVRLFELLLDWTSRSLATASRLQVVGRRDVYNAELDLTSEAFLRARADEEIALTRRRGSTASVLVSRPEGRMSPETERRLLVAMARTFRQLTRLSDSVAFFSERRSFVLFMPDADREKATVVQRKLNGGIQAFDLHPYPDSEEKLSLGWGLAVLEEGEDFDSLLARAFDDVGGEHS